MTQSISTNMVGVNGSCLEKDKVGSLNSRLYIKIIEASNQRSAGTALGFVFISFILEELFPNYDPESKPQKKVLITWLHKIKTLLPRQGQNKTKLLIQNQKIKVRLWKYLQVTSKS